MLAATLRAHTAALHQRVEDGPGPSALLAPGLTPSAYADHLARQRAVVAPLEAALAGVDGLDGVVPDLRRRLVKTAWLDADLAYLGAPDVPTPEVEVPHLTGVPEALGALYVVEGATLGGRVLGRHLARTMNVDETTGGAFFHAYGDERGPMWTGLRDVLDRYADAHPDRVQRVLDAATAVFESFDASLNGAPAAA